MPMNNPEDFGNNNTSKDTCIHCTNQDWSVKSCEEIFEWWVQFFMQYNSDRTLAEKIVRKNMLELPYRKALNWPVATDAEFEEIMKKL